MAEKTLWLLLNRPKKTTKPAEEAKNGDDIPKKLENLATERSTAQSVGLRVVYIEDIVMSLEGGVLGMYVTKEKVSEYPTAVLVQADAGRAGGDTEKLHTLLCHLERMGSRLFNRSQALASCRNTFRTYQELSGHELPLLDTFLCELGGDPQQSFRAMAQEGEKLEYPILLRESKGQEVFFAREKKFLHSRTYLLRREQPYMFQRYVKGGGNMEALVLVVGSKVAGAQLRCCKGLEAEGTPGEDDKSKDWELSAEGKELALKVAKILQVDICGVVLQCGDNGSFFVTEVNASVELGALGDIFKEDVAGAALDHVLAYINSQKSAA
ncbi:beta-citrylglutamate synthase B-like [Petromyzon marinus]|uniref:beta-citrylglutamate synthase B-like n=1 Tax=Petromyzon marinus TaxID=7757 RepID=UPI003F6F0FEE